MLEDVIHNQQKILLHLRRKESITKVGDIQQFTERKK